jgi:hypothetical protein
MSNSTLIFTYVMFLKAGVFSYIFIAFYVYRWIFSVRRQLWMQRQQLSILLKIADRLKVNDEDTSRIWDLNNTYDDNKLS